MKHLKYFESTIETEKEPQEGDYVICHDMENNKSLLNFISNNIGQIVRIENKNKSLILNNPQIVRIAMYHVIYNNIPKELKNHFVEYDGTDNISRAMTINEIIHFSPNKEDLEKRLLNKKYNL